MFLQVEIHTQPAPGETAKAPGARKTGPWYNPGQPASPPVLKDGSWLLLSFAVTVLVTTMSAVPEPENTTQAAMPPRRAHRLRIYIGLSEASGPRVEDGDGGSLLSN